jgi:hypothetical protein
VGQGGNVVSLLWRVLLLGFAGITSAAVVWMVVTGEPLDVWPLSWLGFLVVGAVLATRLPRNRIGWCMFGIGVGLTANVIDLLPIPPEAQVVGDQLATVGFVLIELFILWYPTGAVVTPGWRWVQRAIVALGTLGVVY